MIQHGEGEARFSVPGGTANNIGTRLPRPDRFDGCYNCKKRIQGTCPEHRETTRFKDDHPCKAWELN